MPSHTRQNRPTVHCIVKNGKIKIEPIFVKSKLEQMSFKSMTEGRDGVDDADMEED